MKAINQIETQHVSGGQDNYSNPDIHISGSGNSDGEFNYNATITLPVNEKFDLDVSVQGNSQQPFKDGSIQFNYIFD